MGFLLVSIALSILALIIIVYKAMHVTAAENTEEYFA